MQIGDLIKGDQTADFNMKLMTERKIFKQISRQYSNSPAGLTDNNGRQKGDWESKLGPES